MPLPRVDESTVLASGAPSARPSSPRPALPTVDCLQRNRGPQIACVLLIALSGFTVSAPPTPAAIDQGSEEPAASEAPTASGELSLPDPDLGGLDPAVAEELAEMRAFVLSLPAEAELRGADVGEQVGELGRAYHAHGLSAAAAACYREARRLAPRDPRWSYLDAYLAEGEGRLEEAARGYERTLAADPRRPPALVRLGRVYARLGRPEAAEWALKQALLYDPASAAAEAALGEVMVEAGRFQEALALLRSALARQPGADALHRPLAAAYRELGQFDEARRLMAEAGEVYPGIADPLLEGLSELAAGRPALLARGLAAFRAGDFERAEALFAEAAAADPESVAARLDRGIALERLGRGLQALEEYRAAVVLDPDNVTARRRLGILLARGGEQAAAVEQLETAAALAPADGGVRMELAEALRQAGRAEEALREFLTAAELDPRSELPYFRAAQLLTEMSRHREALEVLEHGSGILPQSSTLALALGRVLAAGPDLELRDGERAVDVLTRAPIRRSISAFETLAMAYAEAGRCKEAVDWQSQAWEAALDGDDPARAEELERMVEHYRTADPCRYPPVAAE